MSDRSARPKSGGELGGVYRGGHGRLNVENGTQYDAVAILVDDPTNSPRRAVFIRTHESGAITSLPAGDYRLRFQLGSDWLRERRFCQTAGTSEFDSLLNFREKITDEGIDYQAFTVTLHTTVGGTATTHQLPEDEFELPPP
jgi:hypothetical protein